jgi:roadblock/LC7 domain-containing protein
MLQKINVQCKVRPELSEKVIEALYTLSQMQADAYEANVGAVSFRPFESFRLTADGTLTLTVQGVSSSAQNL